MRNPVNPPPGKMKMSHLRFLLVAVGEDVLILLRKVLQNGLKPFRRFAEELLRSGSTLLVERDMA